ncbi:MAG: metal ABC transporter ATP-binding protein [Lachnospiraceae bacterium]|nr:metal ABC transporter ATP-binding protein [Lachnospiraceae bacterium]
MVLLTCKDLLIKYEQKTVITGLSFQVNEGDYLCIVGDNGAGKSTLLKCILGLKTVRSGSIAFDPSLHATEIGYLSQADETGPDFPASVREVVMQGCLGRHGLRPFYAAAERAKCTEVLKKLHIESLSSASFRELSGGQRKRVLLARALMTSARLLLLDEPVAALDPNATRDFYDTIKRLNKDGVTIIMVSHDIHEAIHHATHILHLSGETAAFYGTTDEYLQSRLGRTYLDDNGKCLQCEKSIHEHIHGLQKPVSSTFPAEH